MIIQTDNYSPSWEKLNLVPEGDVTLDPDENGELAAVSCSPPAEWDRSHSFASSWLRSWEDGVYLQKQTGLSLRTLIFIWMVLKKKKKKSKQRWNVTRFGVGEREKEKMEETSHEIKGLNNINQIEFWIKELLQVLPTCS